MSIVNKLKAGGHERCVLLQQLPSQQLTQRKSPRRRRDSWGHSKVCTDSVPFSYPFAIFGRFRKLLILSTWKVFITRRLLSIKPCATYIERTIRGTNSRPTFDVWAHNLLSEVTQGKASAVADKRLPNHWAKSRVRPHRVRPVRWQIKGCQTTEPRTFDSGFSGKVNLSTLSFMAHLPTYLLPSVYPITYYLGYPLYVRPSLTLPL
jgi:hypothetical protein